MAACYAQPVVTRIYLQRVVIVSDIDVVAHWGRLHAHFVLQIQFMRTWGAAICRLTDPYVMSRGWRTEKQEKFGKRGVYKSGTVVIQSFAVKTERQVEVKSPKVVLEFFLMKFKGDDVIVGAQRGQYTVLRVKGLWHPVWHGRQHTQFGPFLSSVIVFWVISEIYFQP